jgi:cell division protease FtsH
MDGFDARKGIIIMAATNRPEVLDPALLRPGRFDRQVLVAKPDIRGREDILRIHVKNVKVDENVDLKVVAAAHRGIRRGRSRQPRERGGAARRPPRQDFLDMRDFDEAIDRVIAGLEKKRVMKRQGAPHRRLSRVGARHRRDRAARTGSRSQDLDHRPRLFGALGYTMQLPLEDRYLMTRKDLQSELAVLLGGRSAEEIAFGEISTGGPERSATRDRYRSIDGHRVRV